MATSKRVLVTTFGSAGDLFPLIPVVALLREQGHDVRWAAPRALGLYLRTLRIPSYAIGDGTELRVLQDAELFTCRFGGWASWRQLATWYVLPSLLDDAQAIGRVLDDWPPDVVVATSFAAAGRLAAVVRGVPLAQLSVYPQHQRQLPGSSFGLPLRKVIADAIGRNMVDPVVDMVAWGAGDDTLLLHDLALLGEHSSTSASVVAGFPSWDDGPVRTGDGDKVDRWLDVSETPTLLVTLGSFLGASQRDAWAETAQAVDELGVRALFVGPQVRGDDKGADTPRNILSVGFVPLSRVLNRVDAVVHHGGIGTTFGSLRAGRPAAVIPQGFDQPFNAVLVDRVGAGINAGGMGVGAAIERLLADPGLAARASALGSALVTTEVAAARTAEHIMHWAR